MVRPVVRRLQAQLCPAALRLKVARLVVRLVSLPPAALPQVAARPVAPLPAALQSVELRRVDLVAAAVAAPPVVHLHPLVRPPLVSPRLVVPQPVVASLAAPAARYLVALLLPNPLLKHHLEPSSLDPLLTLALLANLLRVPPTLGPVLRLIPPQSPPLGPHSVLVLPLALALPASLGLLPSLDRRMGPAH